MSGYGWCPDPSLVTPPKVSSIGGGLVTDPPNHARIWTPDPPLHQGPTNSCVAHALAFAIACVTRGEVRASRLDLYRKARELAGDEQKDEGCYPHLAEKAAVEAGYCDERLWPFDPAEVLRGPPAKVAMGSYDQRSGLRFADCGSGAARILSVRRAIASGWPVVLGIYVDKGFEQYTSGVWEYYGPGSGRHMVCAVEYEPRGLKIRNWWQGWGVGDEGWIGWDTVQSAWCGDVRALLSASLLSG